MVTPATLGVGLLEFHQLDRMIGAGRAAARALLDQAGDDLGVPFVVPGVTEPEPPPHALEPVPTG